MFCLATGMFIEFVVIETSKYSIGFFAHAHSILRTNLQQDLSIRESRKVCKWGPYTFSHQSISQRVVRTSLENNLTQGTRLGSMLYAVFYVIV